jgi:hypothetical protein
MLKKIEDGMINLEKCTFRNCYTESPDNEILQRDSYYWGGLFKNKQQYVQMIYDENCKGLNKVNREGKKARNIKIRDIGNAFEFSTVGVPGIDYKIYT